MYLSTEASGRETLVAGTQDIALVRSLSASSVNSSLLLKTYRSPQLDFCACYPTLLQCPVAPRATFFWKVVVIFGLNFCFYMTWWGHFCFRLIIFNLSLCICAYISVFNTGFGLGLTQREWRTLQASFFLCVWLFWKGYGDNHLMVLITKRKVAL